MVQGNITEADTPIIQLGATPSILISDPPSSSSHFYSGRPSCHNPPTLSWLGAGTKYAGLCQVAWLYWPQTVVISSYMHSFPNLDNRSIPGIKSAAVGNRSRLGVW